MGLGLGKRPVVGKRSELGSVISQTGAPGQFARTEEVLVPDVQQ